MGKNHVIIGPLLLTKKMDVYVVQHLYLDFGVTSDLIKKKEMIRCYEYIDAIKLLLGIN